MAASSPLIIENEERKHIDLTDATSTAKRKDEIANEQQRKRSSVEDSDGLRIILMRTKKVLAQYVNISASLKTKSDAQ